MPSPPRRRSGAQTSVGGRRRLASAAWDFLVLSAAAWVVMVVIARLRLVLLPLVAAVMLSSLLQRPRRFLIAHRWPPLAASWGLFVSGAGVIALLGWATIPPIVTEASALGSAATSGVSRLQQWLSASHFGIPPAQTQAWISDLQKQVLGSSGSLVSGILGGATRAGELVLGVLLTAVLAFFLLQDGGRLITSAPRWAGSHAASLAEVFERVQTTLARYLGAAAVNGLVNATLTAGLLFALGLPLVTSIAALTFFAGFVPVIGALVVGILAGLVALAHGGVGTALLAVGGIVAIHHLEGYLISPLIFRRGLPLSGIAIILGLTTGTVVAGVAGAAIAVPALAVAVDVLGWYRSRPVAEPATS